ncbi:hypothetical protein [Candidatus Odyssella thessalonicensis]|uniref:hypothetical protein n=1 Tax=Candidatus Odyssella thessalonicensis TaxID=84647 RepID=UPI000225B492|nr:hypothetical protein [Candidatus Odyssella thessalonicensis]
MFRKSFYNKVINMFWGLVALIFSLSSTDAMQQTETAAERIKRIIKEIEEVDQTIDSDLEDLRRNNSQWDEMICTIGNTGDGKSTLINFLAGKELKPTRSARGGWLVDVIDPIPGMEPGHTHASQTATPRYWYDPDKRRVYYDCPGFRDTRVPENDIRNAYAINKLFQTFSPVKILLVTAENSFAGRAEPVQNTIKAMTEFFKKDINRCDLLLTSDLPADRIPEKGKMYLEKTGSHQLKYTVIAPQGQVIEGILDTHLLQIDITGALTLEKLSTFKSKILDETSRRGHTIKRLGQGCCLVMTGQRDKDISNVQYELQLLSDNVDVDLPREARFLLLDLKNSPEDDPRIALFPAPAPRQEEAFLGLNTRIRQDTKDGILNVIGRTLPLQSNDLHPTPTVSEKAKNFAQELAIEINIKIGEYISNTIMPEIYNYCTEKTQNGNEPATELRDFFNRLATDLDFDHPPTLSVFERNLQNVLQTCEVLNLYDKISKHIKYITFLKRINQNVDYRCADWISAFRSPHSQNLAQGHANNINGNTQHYIANDVVSAIYNYCDERIQTNIETAEKLRDHFSQLAKKLIFTDPPTLPKFEQELQDVLQTCAISHMYERIAKNIHYITFLNRINTHIVPNLRAWINPLTELKARIENLGNGINYTFNSQNKELTLIGYLIGFSDVTNFQGRETITSQVLKLNLFSLRNLLADDNLTLNGATVIGIAPEILQLTQSVTMNLSGNSHYPAERGKAANNTAGNPGRHGENGGNLVLVTNNFKDVYKAAHPQETTKFVIKRNGGSGEGGQAGGDNTDIVAAVEGNEGGWNESSSIPITVGHGVWDPEKDRYFVSALKVHGGTDEEPKGHRGVFYKDHLTISYVKKEYRQAGIKGAKGHRGFAGGQGGIKGHQGLIEVECPNLAYTMADNDTYNGSSGSGGAGSAGGLGGRVRYKVTYTYHPGKYDHSGTDFWANCESGTQILGNGNRYREEAPRFLDHERGQRGDQGDRGQAGGNSKGQGPQKKQLTTDELRALKEDALQRYRNDYNVFANDPVKQKFLGRFPNL